MNPSAPARLSNEPDQNIHRRELTDSPLRQRNKIQQGLELTITLPARWLVGCPVDECVENSHITRYRVVSVVVVGNGYVIPGIVAAVDSALFCSNNDDIRWLCLRLGHLKSCSTNAQT